MFAEAVSPCGLVLPFARTPPHPLWYALGGVVDLVLCLAFLALCHYLFIVRRDRRARRREKDCGGT